MKSKHGFAEWLLDQETDDHFLRCHLDNDHTREYYSGHPFKHREIRGYLYHRKVNIETLEALDKLFLEWRMEYFIFEQKIKANELKSQREKAIECKKRWEEAINKEKEEMQHLCYPWAPVAPTPIEE